jgi:hypothetical protein
MTLDEARALLGVHADDDRTKVRRAYLRAIKEAPPERDPERFMLLREAYDLLRRQGPARATSPSSDLDQLFAAYAQAKTADEREARLADLKSRAPEDPRVERLEYSRAEEADRLAIARRSPDPWLRLRAMEEYPAEFGDEEVVSLASAHGDALGIDLVALLLDRELHDQAHALAKRSIDKGPPGARLLTVLQFYREERRDEGDELFERHRRAARIERPLDQPETQVLLLLAEQLHELPQSFPSSVHSLLAHGAILGDRVSLEEVLEQVRGPLRRWRVARVLTKQGRDLVSDGNLESYARERLSGPFAWALVIVVGLFALVRGGVEGHREIETDSREAYEASPDRMEEVVRLCELERAPACRRAIRISRAAQQGNCDYALSALHQALWSHPETQRVRDFIIAIEQLCPGHL